MTEEAKESAKRKIDKAWKEAVAGEKRTREAKDPGEEGKKAGVVPPTEMDFSLFISGIGMQALMVLGEITNPFTKKKEQNLDQASEIIDVLGMLKEKTKGNLTEQENKTLDNLLYELRMKYVDETKKKAK